MVKIIGSGGGGGGGGGKSGRSRTPKETANNLFSKSILRVLFLLGEGEIQGAANGNLYQSTYIDDVPIENPDGSRNFSDVSLFFRPGTLTQNSIGGFAEEGSEVLVNQQVKKTLGAVTRGIIGSDIDAINIRILFPALQKVNQSNNSIEETSVTYTVDVQVNGAGWVRRIHQVANGKNSGSFEHYHRIDVPPGSSYGVRVTRLTDDSTSSTLNNDMIWVSYTPIADAKLRHPNSALLAVVLSGDQFRSLPQISFRGRFKKVLYPNNYNPTSRVYSGVWNGGFNFGYCNNPAWVAYDLLINSRYGAGDRIAADALNKWSLYAVAQYCDQLVPSRVPGQGSVPRFTFNGELRNPQDAYDLINGIASNFRGSFYWSNGTVTALQDKPRGAVKLFSRANVLEIRDEQGNLSEPCFTYRYSARSSRHTVALVSFIDPSNDWKTEVEYVEHPDGLARFGYNPVQLTAVGCTSRDEARRLGMWTLETEQNLTTIVSFKIGAAGAFLSPGEVIEVADTLRSSLRMAGRIAAIAEDRLSLTLDASPVFTGSATIKFSGANLSPVVRDIVSATGDTIVLGAALPPEIAPWDVWLIALPSLQPQKYAVWSIVDRLNDTPGFYEVTAVEYNDSIYNTVDFGTPLEIPPTTRRPPTIPNKPFNVKAAISPVLREGVWSFDLAVRWEDPLNQGVTDTFTKSYEVQRRSGFTGAWGNLQITSDSTAYYVNLSEGSYFFRVRAVDVLNRVSVWVESVAVLVERPRPLDPIGDLVASQVTGGVVLSWSDSQSYPYGIQGYRVYIDGVIFEEVPRGTNHTGVISRPPGAYSVRVTPFDVAGTEATGGLTSVIGDEFRPPNPSGEVIANFNEGAISLIWVDNQSYPPSFTGYRVYINGELKETTQNKFSSSYTVDTSGDNVFRVYAVNFQGYESLGYLEYFLGLGGGDSSVPNPSGTITKYNSSDGGIILEWTDSQSYTKFKGYRLYLDGELLGETSTKTFSSIIRPPGNYTVAIRAITPNGLQSTGGISVQITLEDILPPKPAFILVQQQLNGTKQFYWESPPEQIHDVVAYRLRYNIGQNLSWGNSHFLKDIPVNLKQFESELFREGSYTVLMKYLDINGNESPDAVFTQVNLFDPVPDNLVETFNFREPPASTTGGTAFLSRQPWEGTLINLTVDTNGDLTVTNPSLPAYFDSTFIVTATGHLKATEVIQGNYALYYERLLQGTLWVGSNDTTELWSSANEGEVFWRQYENYILFPVSVLLDREEYKIRVVILPSGTPGRVQQLSILVDAPDIVEHLNDFPVSALGSRIVPSKPMSVLKSVNLTLQDPVGNSAVRVVLKEKDPVLGALVETYNAAGVRVAGLVDATLVGY